MKIAIFLPSLHGGGAERMMLHLAKGFVQRGHEVDLVLRKATGAYMDNIPDGVRLVDMGAGLTEDQGRLRRLLLGVRLHTPALLLALCYLVPRLAKYLKQDRPDAILSAMTLSNITALAAKRLAGVSCRVVVSERNHPRLNWGKDGWQYGMVLRTGARITYPWADGITAVSQGVADNLAEETGLDRDRIRVIYNPTVTPDIWHLARKPAPFPWACTSITPALLACGRMVAQKDYPTLLRAFQLVRDQRPAKLVILGEGELRPELEALVAELDLADDVWMPGFVANPYAYMSRASVFVLSSRWEGFPNVLVEAMACGAPVVSTDCPSGPAEILEGGKWGKLTPVGDADLLADGILNTLDCKSPPDVQWRAVWSFSIDRAVDQYLEALT